MGSSNKIHIMSYYYKYNFISPDAIYATVKEELSSYFNSGIIDDTMFPIWVKKCLDKLGKCTLQIVPTMLKLENYRAALPPDFQSVREAWICTSLDIDYQLPNSTYQQVTSCSTALDFPSDQCSCVCDPEMIKIVYKTTNTVLFKYKREYLLTPGNLNSCKEFCNYGNSTSSFDIQDGYFITNFCEGDVNLLYYSENTNNILIPDNYEIKEFIEAFLKQKSFEQVFNQTTDESFNQSLQKYQLYKREADSAYIMAETETKKEDIYKKARMTEKTLNRYGKLDIR